MGGFWSTTYATPKFSAQFSPFLTTFLQLPLFSVVCQSVAAVKDKITGELSGTAIFKWKVDRAQTEMLILALTLNRGATLNLSAILFRGFSNPLQPDKEKNLDRLNATIFVVPDTDLELIYQLTL